MKGNYCGAPRDSSAVGRAANPAGASPIAPDLPQIVPLDAGRQGRVTVRALRYAVTSTTLAPGAFALTDAMPLSMPLAKAYISLFPMIWPFGALRTKKGSPFFEVLRS